jgi:23S rRNA pseudouridine1911/1915/1917 synthase
VSGGEEEHRVAAEEAGARLDAFVSRKLGVSMGEARRRIEAGLVRVDGRRRPKGAFVTAGERVTIGASGEAVLIGQASPAVAIIYEDQWLIAIDKPAGMPSHPLRSGEGGTAANTIVARHPECADASVDPREGGLAHRLDTATGGVLIAARDRATWLAMRTALAAEDCQKRYLAEVWGQPPNEGEISATIGRRGRRGRTVRVGSGGRHPLPAETRWRVLARRSQTALVEAVLHAGRAHQVRAHLAAAGFPIVGDDRYDGHYRARPAFEGRAAGLHLHAAAVSFTHPGTGRPLVIEAPPPVWAGGASAQ